MITHLVRIPRYIAIGIIRTYQYVVSPWLGPRCKYYPSCSNYGLTAVTRHGAIKGTALATWRILRCNPWSSGGIDDVPARGAPLFVSHQTSVTHHVTTTQ